MTSVKTKGFIPVDIYANFPHASFIARRINGEVASLGDVKRLVGKPVRAFIVNKDGHEFGNYFDGTLSRVGNELRSVSSQSHSIPSISIDNDKPALEGHSVRTFHIGKRHYLVVYLTDES